MFKNIQHYLLVSNPFKSASDLSSALQPSEFYPCGSLDRERIGFVPPREGGPLAHSVSGQWLLTVCVEKKVLPGAAVKQAVDDRVKMIEKVEGYRPGKKLIRDIKEQITIEMLSRAFSTKSLVNIWIRPETSEEPGLLVIDTPSRSKAEQIIGLITKTLGDLDIALPKADKSPAQVMASWLSSGEADAGFSIDRDCELKSNIEEKASVRYAHHPLETTEIREHIESGKMPTKLALTFDNRLSFVFTDKAEIKRIAFLDGVMDDIGTDSDNVDDLEDAKFFMMTEEVGKLIPALNVAMA